MKRVCTFFAWIPLVIALVSVGSARAQAPSATRWQRNPITLPVTVKLTDIYAETNTNVRLTLADASLTQNGYNCLEATNAQLVVANLKPRQEYWLTVVGSNITSFNLDLDWMENWTPITRRARAAKPKSYRMLINRQLSTDGAIGAIFNSSACSEYTNTWTIELVERLPANWRLEDGSDDPQFAAGDGAWAEIGPGRSQERSRAAISWSVALGRLLDGGAAGRISLRETGITPATFTRSNLFFTTGSEIVRDQVRIVTETTNSPVIQQVFATQTFVDFVQLTNYGGVELRFYRTNQVGTATNSSGHFTSFSGNPFVVWAIVNPVPATSTTPAGTNELQIIERRNGLNRTNQIVYNPSGTTNTWVLRYGTGSERRVEQRGVVVNTSPATNRIETVDIRYEGTTNVAYRAIETYTRMPWGFELTRTETDPDNNPVTNDSLVTTMEYYTDVNDIYTYGKLMSTVHPDGNWEKRIYDDDIIGSGLGTLLCILRPNKNSPATPADAEISNSVSDWMSSTGSDDLYSVGTINTHWRQFSDYPVWVRERQLSNMTFSDLYVGEVNFSTDMLDINEDGTWAIGTQTVSYSQDDEFGYANKPIAQDTSGRQAREASFYQGGTYNPGSRTFTASTNAISDGPVWRKSTVYGGPDTDLSLGGDEGFYLSMLEGEPVVCEILGNIVYTNRSWRINEVFQDGNLVLRERLVLSALTGNPTNEATFSLIEQWVYQNDTLGHPTNVIWFDGASGVSRVIYRADYRGGSTFDTDLKLWEEDEQGIRTTYSYDSLKRVVSSVKEGISASGSFPAQQAITNSFTLDARGQQLTDSLSAVGVSISSSQQLDLAGRPIRVVETNGLVTTMLYELGGRKVTTTLPSGATEITEYYLDRRLASRTGTAIVNEFHDWRYVSGGGGISPEDDRERTGPDSGRVQIEHLVRYASATSPRYRLEGTDWKNDTNRVEVLDWSLTNKVVQYIGWYDPYNALPDFVRSVTRRTQADLSIAYDFAGRTNAIGVEIPAEGAVENPALTGASQLDPVSTNRVTRFRTYFNQVGGTWYESTTNFTYKEIGSSNITVLGITRQRLNNFASGNIVSETIEIDVDTNITVTTITVDRANKRLTEVTDIAQSLLNATNITVNGLLQWQSTPTVAQPVRLGYDSIGRGVGFTNTLGFSKAKVFNSAAQLASETDFSGITTVYTYHPQNSSGAGQIATAIKNGKVTRYSYTPRGELTRVWGDIPYPEERLYNNYGEMTELRTFRGGAGWNGNTWPASPGSFDRTIWAYQEATGLMTNKTDNANRSVNYTYWQGLLKTRTWARGGTVMTNRYNHLGEIIGIDYSDSVTPDVAYGLNVDDDSQFSRTGKPLITVDGSGTWVHAYDHADRLISSVCTNGLFNGITISNRINGVYGREMVRVSGIPTSLETRFGWDSFGRLNLVTNGLAGVSYGYLANSDLLQTTTSRYNGSAPILTATRSWDFGVRLREIRNVAGNVDVSRHNYVYDAMGRRTAATLEDGSLWSYDYNDRDEVIGGRHLWPDGAPFAGQQYAYSYDNLGNRLNTLTGGDGSGIGQRATAYEVNGLNQYAKRHVPSTEDVIGIANVPAVVSVNGATNWVHERLEYFWRDLPVTNSAGPSWTPVWVTATQGASVTNSSTNYLLTAPTNQVFSYDFDGNLTGDSLWNYVWDGENRLLSVESVTALPDAGRRRVEFAYDHQGRRIAKKSYIRNAGTWQMQSSILFVSDGWQLLGELNATNKSAIRSFSWGPDLSGVEMNLGGVGGLALLIDHGTGEVHYPSYDGMGNIIALVSNDVQISAKYQYGPFGEVIQTSGNYARKNPFRWATKFADEETGLVYFGHRYYSQATGRWISRDPIGESDLLNLYCYVGNRSIGSIDPDGLAHFALDSSAPHVHMDRRGPNGGPAYSLNMSLDSSGSISVDVGPKGNHPYPGKAKATQNWEQSWNNPKFRNGVNNTIDNEMRNIRDAFAAAGHNKQKIAGAVSRQSKLSNLKRWFSAGAKIGRNVAVGAIGFAALAELGSTSARASDSIASYAQNKYIRGDQAQADLDAIDVATQVMEATGNYFYGYAALDGLL